MTLALRPKTGTISAAATSAASVDGVNDLRTFLEGGAAAVAVITGTWVATLQFEGQAADGTWISVPAVPVTGGAAVTSTTANGNFVILGIGMVAARVRCSAYTSGTPAIAMQNALVGGIQLTLPGTGTAAGQVQGNVAVGAAVSGGNPLGLGLKGASSLLEYGVTANLGNATDGAGVLGAGLMLYSTTLSQALRMATARDQSDGALLSAAPAVAPFRYNGTNYDHDYNNFSVADILSVTAQTTTQTSADITNYNARGVLLFFHVTVAGGAGLTLRAHGKDPSSGNYNTLNSAPTAITAATGTAPQMIAIYPGASAAAGLAQAAPLPVPRTWRVQVVHGDATSSSYKVSYAYII